MGKLNARLLKRIHSKTTTKGQSCSLYSTQCACTQTNNACSAHPQTAFALLQSLPTPLNSSFPSEHSVPTSVKEVCISPFYFLTIHRDLSALLSPTSTYHQLILCNLPYVPSFDSKCIKRTTNLPFSGSFSQSVESLLLGMSSFCFK